MTQATTDRPRGFLAFYRGPYVAEHAHPITIAAHAFGTVAGLAFAVWSLLSPWPWLALLFPAVHAAPGLAAHRLFERNAAVGDVRVTRKDCPPVWFLTPTTSLCRPAARRHATSRDEGTAPLSSA